MIHVCRSFGAFTTRIDESLGCGESGIMDNVRAYLTRRFGVVKMQETNFTRAGVDIWKGKDSPIDGAQKAVTGELQLLPTSAELWSAVTTE